MGFALAEAARDRGARVTVVAGPVSIEPPHGVEVERVTTAQQMERAMQAAAAGADVIVMAAAVSDYRPAKPSAQKLKRDGQPLTITLEANPDILAGLGMARRKGQTLVGFALETDDGVVNARKKLAAKSVELIVLNTPADGIGGETNVVTLVEARSAVELPEASKREVAERILDRVLELRGGGSAPAPELKVSTASKKPRKKGAR